MREYDACEQRRQQMAARNPTPGNRLNAASAAQNLARLRQLYGDLDSARSLMERARLIVEEEVARAPADPRNLRRASLMYQMLHEVNLAEIRPSLDNAEEAWNWRQKSSAITARLTAKDPANADARDLRSADDVASGMLLSLLGRSKEAAARIETGVALTRELKKASPNVTYFDTRESMALRWLAHAYSQLGRHDAARKAAAEAVALSERDWKTDPESAPGQLFLVNAWRMKALVETAARDFKAAHAALDHVVDMTGKWSAAPKHELFYAVSLSNYYQSYAQLARAESKPQVEREWLDRIDALWRSWPEQNGYTKMRQAHPTVRYPW
jgi:tetratricopeptide (TPR) repeat protein